MTVKKGEIRRHYLFNLHLIRVYFLILGEPVYTDDYCSECSEQKAKARCMSLENNRIFTKINLCECYKLLGEKK